MTMSADVLLLFLCSFPTFLRRRFSTFFGHFFGCLFLSFLSAFLFLRELFFLERLNRVFPWLICSSLRLVVVKYVNNVADCESFNLVVVLVARN